MLRAFRETLVDQSERGNFKLVPPQIDKQEVSRFCSSAPVVVKSGGEPADRRALYSIVALYTCTCGVVRVVWSSVVIPGHLAVGG